MATKFENQLKSAIKEYNKSISAAEKTIADATAQGKTKVANKAQSLLNDLRSYAPIIDTLKRAESGKSTYTGAITQGLADQLNLGRANQTYGGIPGFQPDFITPREASVAGFEANASDADYVSSGGTGISNTGRKYINGRLATDAEWSAFLGGGGGGLNTVTEASLTGGLDSESERRRREGQSAYTLLLEQFNQYGLGGLVEPLKAFIVEGLSPAEFTIRLRDTDAYKKRFAANQQRINKGLRALSEAEYIGLEDQYQNIMRNYGLPASYYARGDMGRQEGFEKFIGGDVSAAELEDRIQTAQNRVINAAPEVANALRAYYPDITNGDILAYSLDPDKALTEIRRKVTAAEIGAGAAMAGLTAGVARAEELGRYGVTGEQARQGFRAVAEVAPRGGQLAEFYRQTPYTQTTAEQEVFGLAGATEAERQRKKLTQLEQASFAGQAGIAGGAIARDRAGAF
jgi:hypothetical protein